MAKAAAIPMPPNKMAIPSHFQSSDADGADEEPLKLIRGPETSAVWDVLPVEYLIGDERVVIDKESEGSGASTAVLRAGKAGLGIVGGRFVAVDFGLVAPDFGWVSAADFDCVLGVECCRLERGRLSHIF